MRGAKGRIEKAGVLHSQYFRTQRRCCDSLAVSNVDFTLLRYSNSSLRSSTHFPSIATPFARRSTPKGLKQPDYEVIKTLADSDSNESVELR